jgi:O-acetyl-ADP-ribose deacetylase
MASKIICVVGDITEQKVDAIVNAANRTLLGGGGVDGAIHMVAGRGLFEECLLLGGCEDGEAKITAGYNLPSKHVIHTVGPVYGQANGKEADILASCYRNALQLAKEHNLHSIAFPAISTGAFGYPKDKAAMIAVKTVLAFLEEGPMNDIEVRFVLYSPEDAFYYQEMLRL